MEKKTLNKVMYTGSAIAGAFVLFTAYKNKQKKKYWVYEDNDMRNSVEVDRKETVNAKYDEEEIGLTELDSAYRSEWQANGFPQTHRRLEELEE